ncbi:MAG: PEGA domain-containing protein [Brevinema sp.]
MKKTFSLLILLIASCSKLPVKEEIEYRNRLENEIIKTFPQKLCIVIHPFTDLTPKNTNDTYLSGAIPDVIEGMLEPMKATLAYVPFDFMPFYVSESLSNLFQSVQKDTNSNNSATSSNNETSQSYFEYLTNYLIKVPVQVTQLQYNLTTNTNYIEIVTNTFFEQGESKTNFVSNEILKTETNSISTNLVLEDRNIITATNMLLLLYEEFPELINYLSYIPLEIRRATLKDISNYTDYADWAKDPKAWKRKETARLRAQKEAETNESSTNTLSNTTEQTENTYPKEDFTLTYHITGNFKSSQDTVFSTPDVNISVEISDLNNTGLQWWINKYNTPPPSLTKIITKLNSMNTNDIESFKKEYLRIPYKKKKLTPRLQEEFNIYSTNFRAERPEGPTNSELPEKIRLRLRVKENKIPTEMLNWLKVFHSTFINRPYATLMLTTNPKDTLVYLNGFFIGKTPLIYPTAPLGEQRISFIKDGFQREELLTEIKANRTNKIDFNLSQQNNSGELFVNSPTPTDVFLDSQYKGQTPLLITNLTLNKKYRLEVLNPSGNLSSNRNSFYKSFTLTTEKPRMDLDAEFKNFETSYKANKQKGLLAGTYISWIATLAILGGSIYTQARQHEFQSLARANGISPEQRREYQNSADQFGITSQVTLYTAIAGAIISSGIMGWYLHSKAVYLGFDYDPTDQEVFANIKLKF